TTASLPALPRECPSIAPSPASSARCEPRAHSFFQRPSASRASAPLPQLPAASTQPAHQFAVSSWLHFLQTSSSDVVFCNRTSGGPSAGRRLALTAYLVVEPTHIAYPPARRERGWG